MITKKELDYVSGWANKVPYPGVAYAEKTVEKLKECFKEFNNFYANKKYDITLSNGEEFLFEILDKNLCHILGVDYKNINSEYFDEYREDVLKLYGSPKSYELLTAIINNLEDVLRYDFDRYDKNGRVLNYYRIMVKCSIFEKLSDFSRFNFGVINMNKDIFERVTGKNISSNSEKFLYVQSNEAQAPYFMMGILKDSEKNSERSNVDEPYSYATETLIAPQNHQDFFNHQMVTIPTQILIIDDKSMDKIEATSAEKIALLNQYKTIINSAHLPNKINIYSDYETMLAEQSNQMTKRRTI